MPVSSSVPRFLPSASLEMLRRRADLLKAVRAFFDGRGFWEVETPVLSRDTVIDRHLDPLAVTLWKDPREPERGTRLWLQTSPEFGMKRLLSAGATAIYQVSKAFRGGEVGPLHNPEFTMLEWYRVGDGYLEGMQLLDDLAGATLGRGACERLTYRDAFLQFAKVDPQAAGADEFALDDVLTARVQPQLGRGAPTILYDFPADQAALAQVRSGANPAAERFELFVDGVELANGYHELLDANVLRERNERNNALRIADGKYPLPVESRLRDAMDAGLPPCAGCALGFDRLVMVAAGAQSLAEVMAFPIDRA